MSQPLSKKNMKFSLSYYINILIYFLVNIKIKKSNLEFEVGILSYSILICFGSHRV